MRQKGLIVIGYQGIGKSSCAGKDCIDLESSCFKINNERHEDWAVIYTRIAMHIANQGYVVFTSSHKCVVDIFKTMPLMEKVGKVCIFCLKYQCAMNGLSGSVNDITRHYLRKIWQLWGTQENGMQKT